MLAIMPFQKISNYKFQKVHIGDVISDLHIRGLMAAKNYNYESADNKFIIKIPRIISIITLIPGCDEKTIALYKFDGFA